MTFGDLLREYREETGLSQNALARIAGLDPTHVSRLERDMQGPPRTATVTKLVGAFGWSMSDERAQSLLAEAGYGRSLSASLGSPIDARGNRRSVQLIGPTLRELRSCLLRAVDLIRELEQLVGDEVELK